MAASTHELAELCKHAERYFLARWHSSWVPGYLRKRGFDEHVQRKWRIGYAPNTWTGLTTYLRRLGFSPQAIEASGLAYRSRRGGLIDAFRDRAMFPITRADAATIGFIGRSRDGAPKYLNSPGTPIYQKGSALFGLHRVRHGIRPVIVEGPLDAIAIDVATRGEFAGVALCGTALTARQVAALAETGGRRPLLALDGDRAGHSAALRAYPLVDADAVRLPDGCDPCDLLSTGALGAMLRQAQPLADLVVDAAIERWEGTLQFAEGTVGAMRAAAGVIARLRPDDVARQVDRVAVRLGLPHAEVTAAITDRIAAPDLAVLAGQDFPAAPIPSSTAAPLRGRTPDERHRVPRRSAS